MAARKRKSGDNDGGVACADGKKRSGKSAGITGARKLRLEQIRKEIENGTYETEGKLRIAISRLIDDVLDKCRKERDR